MSMIPDARVTVAIPNGQVATAASSVSAAVSILQPLLPYSSIVAYVAVSNEPDANFGASQLSTVILPALQNTRQALAQLNIPAKVTIPFTYGVIGNSYPPSAGTLNSAFATQLKALLQVRPISHLYSKFLWMTVAYNDSTYVMSLKVIADDKSRVEINTYTYFSWYYNTAQINLDYALGKPGGAVKVVDGAYTYTNMFDSMYDAARVALDK